MNKKEIQKKYNKKIKLINEYNKYYYNESSPLVSDKDYDELKKTILSLEKEYFFLKSEKSPSISSKRLVLAEQISEIITPEFAVEMMSSVTSTL